MTAPARGPTSDEQAENRELRRRVRLLEQENEGAAPGGGVPVLVEPAGKVMYPLVRELAGDGIPVTVTCQVLGIARQPYYRWLATPVTDGELEAAHLANAVFDAHRDDPEFGYRFLADEVRQAGHDVYDRTVWRICRDYGWWSSFGKPKRRKGRTPGTPADDDLARRKFTADALNRLWLADITEHPTGEGKLYLCAIKDVFSNRTVGWSIDGRMKARLVVAAIEMAVARRGDVAGCILHSDRGSQSISRSERAESLDPPPHGRLDGQVGHPPEAWRHPL